jgi:CRP-like cAMP-binding protein
MYKMGFDLDKYYYKSDDIFLALPPVELALLNESKKLVTVKKGKLLFRQGSYPAGVYILNKGRVKMYQVNVDGKQTIIYFYTAGDVMGYRPMICKETHPLSAEALEDCVYSFFPRDAFLRILATSTALANLLLQNLGHEFSVWVNNMSLFSSQSVKERTALALVKLNEIYRSEKGGVPIIILSRGDLAAYVGTAKETLVRLLGDLKRRRIISVKGQHIRIVDKEALLEIIN